MKYTWGFINKDRFIPDNPKLLLVILRVCASVLLVTIFSEILIPPGEAQQIPTSNSCVVCHAELDDQTMNLPVQEWKRSVHQPAGISCKDCHGGNPSSSIKEIAHGVEAAFVGIPNPEEVHELCGTCHNIQMENFLSSPHGIEGDFWPNCVDCHKNHDIATPQVSLISVPENCEDCHEEKILHDFIDLTNRGLRPASEFRAKAENIRWSGVPIDMILTQTTQAREAFVQKASHVFVLDKMIATIDSLEQIYPSIQKKIDIAQTEVDTRVRFGWLFVSLFLVLAGTLWLYGRSLPNDHLEE